MKHVFIRVDGNEIIATGHIMRCMSIADQLRKRKIEVTFVVADENPCQLLKQKGFRVDVLHTVWNDLDQEIDAFKQYIVQNKVEYVLLDTYYVTESYIRELTEYVKLMYIDDIRKFIYPVDVLIRYAAFIDEEEYIKLYAEQNLKTKFLLGCNYVPLREEFSNTTFEVKEKIQKVLITTGGTDRLNVAGKLLRVLLAHDACKYLEYHVIVGCFNRNKDELVGIAINNSNVHLHENVTNISVWMKNCDVAISAAGTTIYELCACGTPTICMAIADNQKNAKRWEENGYMKYAGNAYKDMDQCLEMCKNALIEYQQDYKERVEISNKMQSLIDGKGSMRIAEYIDNIWD